MPKNSTQATNLRVTVIGALKKFRVYFLGLHFQILIDCNIFAKTLCTRVAKWVLLLQEFDYEIELCTGSHRFFEQVSHIHNVDAFTKFCCSYSTKLKSKYHFRKSGSDYLGKRHRILLRRLQELLPNRKHKTSSYSYWSYPSKWSGREVKHHNNLSAIQVDYNRPGQVV